jgi:ubiquinone/menaquinone biosynthesis C-methylase UbiE
MEKVDFDEYASNYDQILEDQLGNFGDIAYYSEYKVRVMAKHIHSPKTVMEFGCGMGRNIPYFTEAYPEAEVIGYDISESSLELARKSNPKIEFTAELESKENAFDCVFISNVYHHIHPDLRDTATAGLFRSLKPGGQLIIFEHNPYNPITRHMVNTCEFDEDAILLKKSETKKLFEKHGFKQSKGAYTLFFPSALKALSFMEPAMGFIPMGAQYYIIFKK